MEALVGHGAGLDPPLARRQLLQNLQHARVRAGGQEKGAARASGLFPRHAQFEHDVGQGVDVLVGHQGAARRPRLVGHLCVKHFETEQHAVELVFVAQYHVAIVVGFLEFEQALQQEFKLHNVAQGGRVLARRSGRRCAKAEAVQLREQRQGRGRSAVHEG